MTLLTFSILLLFFSFLAGLLGALTGLGGGIIVIPVLVVLFKVNIHYAMGASLISVIATSSGAAAAYLKKGYTNIRIGMYLEVATVLGAFTGALLISVIPKNALAILFSGILFLSAYMTIRRHEEMEQYTSSHPWATALQLDGTYEHHHEQQTYHVQHAPLGLIVMGFAGLLSGLLGIGSGSLKVLAMDHILRLPYRVSTTTSNFMIGITAATSIGIYFNQGYVNPTITFPVMLGVLAGSFFGAKVLHKIQIHSLRVIFSVIICLIGVQMLYQTFTGQL